MSNDLRWTREEVVRALRTLLADRSDGFSSTEIADAFAARHALPAAWRGDGAVPRWHLLLRVARARLCRLGHVTPGTWRLTRQGLVAAILDACDELGERTHAGAQVVEVEPDHLHAFAA